MDENLFYNCDKKSGNLRKFTALILLFVFGIAFAQYEVGDFRSRDTGSWKSSSTWQICTNAGDDSSALWRSAVGNEYPGTGAHTGKNVTISCGTTVQVPNGTYAVGQTLKVKGKLQISIENGNNSVQFTNALPMEVSIDGGLVQWVNNGELRFPAGTSIEIGEGTCTSNGGYGFSGLKCSGAQRLVIGNVIYAACQGGSGVAGDFETVNEAGGSAKAVATAEYIGICSADPVANKLIGTLVRPIGVTVTAHKWEFIPVAGEPSFTFPSGTNLNQQIVPIGTITAPGNYKFRYVATTKLTTNPPVNSNPSDIIISVDGSTAFKSSVIDVNGVATTVHHWDNTIPSPTNKKNMIIAENYSTGALGSLSGCSCTVNANKILTISPDTYVDVVGAVVNNGGSAANLVVESDGNLIQKLDTAVNTGSITVKRVSPMKKSSYTYWSSPVGSQNLKDFSPGTAQARFYEYRESDNKFYTVAWTSAFQPGKGYAIMAPANYGTALTDFPGEFKGVPNNGEVTYTLQLSSGLNRGFNMVGNPYPSNLDFEKLYAENSGKIYNTAYFWTNTDPNRPPSTNGNGDNYSGNGYAIYNGIGGVAPTRKAAEGSSLIPTQYIKVGQGFIVQSKVNQQNLTFKNSMRSNSNDSFFFSRKVSVDKDRFWLELVTPANNVNMILIGYVPEATNGFEMDYDAKLLSVGSDSFYSILDDKKLGIQGRKFPLENSDVVNLGVKLFQSGSYTIRMTKKDGVFRSGQKVYLKDKSTGVITDLSEKQYTFEGSPGEFDGRFEIVYEVQNSFLGTDRKDISRIQVYRNGSDFVVQSADKKINTVEVYDASGKLVTVLKGNQQVFTLPAETLGQGMYILKIDRGGELTHRKVMR